ncbi:YccF domain-containing protein [Ilumatobacter sp.]|uniref:YccF domain-containing protein n=1 Tax=Ilumatobacter sp. TaxID=1967498 RepID=UPI003AF51C01
METVGNLLWLVMCGVWFALGWLFWALILAATFVGLPFARQCVELARFSLWPFGRTIVADPTGTQLGTVGAILWTIPGALMAIVHVLAGALLYITVIGIPFGTQSMEMAGVALRPFGKMVVRTNDLASLDTEVASDG